MTCPYERFLDGEEECRWKLDWHPCDDPGCDIDTCPGGTGPWGAWRSVWQRLECHAQEIALMIALRESYATSWEIFWAENTARAAGVTLCEGEPHPWWIRGDHIVLAVEVAE
jgi:hypothetical protein